MTQRFVDDPKFEEFFDVDEPVEIIGASGRSLGWFHPALYEGVDAPVSEEELDRRSTEPDGRTLAEILRDLEQNA